MNKFKKNSKIYIIESQSDEDLLDNRTEGKSLSSGLDLAEIRNQYFQVTTTNTFDKALYLIAKEIKENPEIIPFIHFSAHGNEDGIQLTDTSFIDWKGLRDRIDMMNKGIGKIKIFEENDVEYSRLNLSFSVCEGFNAKKIQDNIEDSKYLQLVGPIEEVEWADSLIAYMTFYHLMFYKSENLSAKEIVRKMNIASGLVDIFCISPGFGLN